MNYADLDLDFQSVSIFAVNQSDVLVASQNDEYILDLQRYFTDTAVHYSFTAARGIQAFVQDRRVRGVLHLHCGQPLLPVQGK